MNNRGLKNRTAISNAVDTTLYNKLKELSEETMIPVSKLLDKAIELVLKSMESLLNSRLYNFYNFLLTVVSLPRQGEWFLFTLPAIPPPLSY